MSENLMPERVWELVQMHRYMRPAYSAAEAAFNEQYLDAMPGVWKDTAGNRIACIGDNPVVLWSSHTDTVHKLSGQQRLVWGGGILETHKDERGGCLGADCTVGVWIMRQMYLARVPGLYIWHAAEEIGGGGSDHIACHTPELLRGVQAAIAFDRKGFSSVVTHQWAGRTASEGFANSLALQLGGDFKPDAYGTFTDTANYAEIIPECTNISVGYTGAHTQGEDLDTRFADALLQKMLKLDVSELKIMRDPSAVSDWGRYMTSDSRSSRSTKTWRGHSFRVGKTEADELSDLLWERPQEVAEYLVSLGFTRGSLEYALHDADMLGDEINTAMSAGGEDDPALAAELDIIRAEAAAARAADTED